MEKNYKRYSENKFEKKEKSFSLENIKIRVNRTLKKTIKAAWIHEDFLYVLCTEKNITKLTEYFSQNYKIPKERVRVGVFYDLIKEISERNRRVLISIRDGKIIYDPFKFIISLKINIKNGLMLGTKEAILKKFFIIKEHIKDVENIKYLVLDNLYTSLVESSQAALIMKDQKVVIPRLIPELLKEHLLNKGIGEIEIKYAEDVIKTFKDYEHKKIDLIEGKKLDEIRMMVVLFRESIKKII